MRSAPATSSLARTRPTGAGSCASDTKWACRPAPVPPESPPPGGSRPIGRRSPHPAADGRFPSVANRPHRKVHRSPPYRRALRTSASSPSRCCAGRTTSRYECRRPSTSLHVVVLERLIQRAQAQRDGARQSGREPAPVDLAHRRQSAEGAGDESLLRGTRLVQREIADPYRYTFPQAELDNLAAGDAVEAVLAARGQDLALPHTEEIRGVAARHRPERIEHQGFVGARIDRLAQRHDQIEAAV